MKKTDNSINNTLNLTIKPKTMKKTLIALSALTLIFSSCKEEEPLTPKTTDTSTDVNFVFKQYYDGYEVTAADFGAKQFLNAKGTSHTISKLQYLISKTQKKHCIITFYNCNTNTTSFFEVFSIQLSKNNLKRIFFFYKTILVILIHSV